MRICHLICWHFYPFSPRSKSTESTDFKRARERGKKTNIKFNEAASFSLYFNYKRFPPRPENPRNPSADFVHGKRQLLIKSTAIFFPPLLTFIFAIHIFRRAFPPRSESAGRKMKTGRKKWKKINIDTRRRTFRRTHCDHHVRGTFFQSKEPRRFKIFHS